MSSQEELIAQRRANLDALAALGVEIYPHRFDRRHTVSELVEAHGEKDHDTLEAERPETVTAGRILAVRSFGKANFLVVSDGRRRIQVYIRQDALPPLDFQIFKCLDFGDWIGVEGRLFRTKTNELTIWASRLHFFCIYTSWTRRGPRYQTSSTSVTTPKAPHTVKTPRCPTPSTNAPKQK